MKRITRNRKNAKQQFQNLNDEEWLREELVEVMTEGKRALDDCMLQVGKMLAETLMYMEREELAGTDYHPRRVELKKWGSQRGSIYLGNSKVRVEHPRLRDLKGETQLRTYERFRNPGEFSQELLSQAMSGMSGRRYAQVMTHLAQGFGISASSVSRRLIQATSEKMKQLLERDLKGFEPFAIFLDTVHRGGRAFVVALGINTDGKKEALGFWEGATENHEVAQSLLSDLESRGLRIHNEIIFITDGGGGIIRALKDRFGEYLVHQRCTIHKDRNLQKHLPKRYRQEAHRRFRTALEFNRYEDAKAALGDLRQWLSPINESAVRSLLEAEEELLTLHRLGVSELLRKTLHSTNAIESVFSTVRSCEKNIRRYRESKMSQRWLAAVLLYAEKGFRTVKGHREIPNIIATIRSQRSQAMEKKAA